MTDAKQHHIRIPAELEAELRRLWSETFTEHQIGSFRSWLVAVVLPQWLRSVR